MESVFLDIVKEWSGETCVALVAALIRWIEKRKLLKELNKYKKLNQE